MKANYIDRLNKYKKALSGKTRLEIKEKANELQKKSFREESEKRSENLRDMALGCLSVMMDMEH